MKSATKRLASHGGARTASLRGTAALTALALVLTVGGLPNCRGGTSLVDPWCATGSSAESPEDDCSCCEPGSTEEETCGQLPGEAPRDSDEVTSGLQASAAVITDQAPAATANSINIDQQDGPPPAVPIYLTNASLII